MTLRLATYNVHKLVGGDGKWNETRILNVLRAMNADILAIQELVVAENNPSASTPEAFASAAGYHAVSQRLLRPGGMVQYNMLLTKEPVRDITLVDLPRDWREPRGAILAEIKTESGPLCIAATHLGLTPRARTRQLAHLLEECGKKKFNRLALLGDLNIMFPWEPAARLLRRAFPNQPQPTSFPARMPFLRFDALYLRPANILSLRAFSEDGARTASDHLPLIADVVFADAG